MIFLFFNLSTLLFLFQKLCCIGVFVPDFHRFCTGFSENRKNSANFLQFFLLVYQ